MKEIIKNIILGYCWVICMLDMWILSDLYGRGDFIVLSGIVMGFAMFFGGIIVLFAKLEEKKK